MGRAGNATAPEDVVPVVPACAGRIDSYTATLEMSGGRPRVRGAHPL